MYGPPPALFMVARRARGGSTISHRLSQLRRVGSTASSISIHISIARAARTKQNPYNVAEFRVAKLWPGILTMLLTPFTADDATFEAPCPADEAAFEAELLAALATLLAPCVAVDAAPDTEPAAVFAALLTADSAIAAPLSRVLSAIGIPFSRMAFKVALAHPHTIASAMLCGPLYAFFTAANAAAIAHRSKITMPNCFRLVGFEAYALQITAVVCGG